MAEKVVARWVDGLRQHQVTHHVREIARSYNVRDRS